ncbi:MAG: sugar ABC transporter ATP-binding protein [Eubacteriales bacterium]|nr:sugar ABC transporter ATP-binding protein [Eubacteriales bacterium]
MADNFLLSMTGISKHFGGVQALENVDFEVNKSEIVSVVGENGAGKSTLMKVLLGINHPDTGEIVFKGDVVKISAPQIALDMGIAMIHQEISLIPDRTIAENIWLGREPMSFGFINWKKLYENTEFLFEKMKIKLNPKTIVRNLNVAQMQMVEIVRAISYNSKIIIMDEPTSALTDVEVKQLFGYIRDLKNKGVSIIYITHKLEEVFEIAERVVILRDGKRVGSSVIKEITKERLISLMVGRELKNIFPKEFFPIGEVVLEAKNLTRHNVFKNISFSVKSGEILGIAGLMGAGRTEVMRALFAVDKLDDGEILLNGKKVHFNTPKQAIKKGFGMVMEDRKKFGLVSCRSLMENISLANYSRYNKGPFIKRKTEVKLCKDMIEKVSIKAYSYKQRADSLSGGNQQKVVVAKWLMTQPKVMILDEPTRGIDVGAKREIFRIMTQLAKMGMAIIMISSELPEILGMSDRIIVMREGELCGEIDRKNATQESVMTLAFGGKN